MNERKLAIDNIHRFHAYITSRLSTEDVIAYDAHCVINDEGDKYILELYNRVADVTTKEPVPLDMIITGDETSWEILYTRLLKKLEALGVYAKPSKHQSHLRLV